MTEKRRIIELLPDFLQNSDQLRKFFKSTVDHWFQPEKSKKLSNYIGRIPSFFNAETDFYQVEPTSERQFYQLEPAMVSRDDGEINESLAYPDLINQLRFQGALTNNHSRLFSQQYYSWAPPIDIDKFTNFSNYYWYPEGPSLITIRGNASNFIDVEQEILGQTNYTSPNAIQFTNGMKVEFDGTFLINSEYTNRIFIVEGVGTSIILVDFDDLDPDVVPVEYNEQEKEYILIERGSTDRNPWSRSNHWYHRDVLTFSQPGSALLIESEEAILWDADPWDTTPWDSTVTVLTPTINLDSSRQGRRPIIEFFRNIELYNYGQIDSRRIDLVEKVRTDVFSEIQNADIGTIQVDGITITDGDRILVISDNNPGVNNRVYEVNELEVSPGVFKYQLLLLTDGVNSNGSPAENEKALILRGNFSGLEYYFNGEDYVISQRKRRRNQQPLFNLYDKVGTKLSNEDTYPGSTFIGNRIFSYQIDTSVNAIIDSELNFGVNYQNFVQISEIVFENYIETETYSFENEPLNRIPIKGYYYYKINSEIPSYGNGWNLSKNKSIQNVEDGFYEIPLNLQANPNYDEITTTTRSQLLEHFKSIIINQEGINNQEFTRTNFRDTKRDTSLGTEILQHHAPLLKTMLLASDDSIDYILSTRYVSREYRRFRNKLLKKIETFISQGYTDNIPYSQWLEDAIRLINVAKTKDSNFPFKYSRVAPVDENYASAFYTALVGQTEFNLPANTSFNTEEIDNISAVLVYVNNNLLLIDSEYSISNNVVSLTTGLSGGETVEVRFYENIKCGYVPPTGTVLGLTPAFRPERFIDTTYTEPRNVIRLHDGSYHIEFGDARDDVIFEFEKRIYNSLYSKFREERQLFFDPRSVLPGKFRNNEYSFEDYREILTPIFTRWATAAGVDWSNNNTYDQSDWRTWNWSDVLDVDGTTLPGNWRGIYMFYYDTDSPNTRPWEMLGFSVKPDWWESEYGSGAYTSNDTNLWADLEDGRIRQGAREGIDELYVRPGLQQFIPVDEFGNLKSPLDIGIVSQNPGIEDRQNDWKPGDMSPQETAFWRSNEYSFILSQILYLMNPNEWIEYGWDTEAIEFAEIDPTQLINVREDRRLRNSELHVAFEKTDGIISYRSGVQEWISNYLESLGQDITSSFGDLLRDVSVSLAWKNAGFVKKTGLRFQADSYSPGSEATTPTVFIQDEDIIVNLYDSPSVKETFYSGVLVEWTGTGYSVVRI